MKLFSKKIKSLKTGALCILVALMGIMVIILVSTAHGQNNENNIVNTNRMHPAATSGDNVKVIEAIYYDYLSVECADGKSYPMDEEGNWFNTDGKVRYQSGEVLTAVIVDGKIVTLLRE